MENSKKNTINEHIRHIIATGILLAGILAICLPVKTKAAEMANVVLAGNGIGAVDNESFEWEKGTAISKSKVDAYNQHPKDEYANTYRFTGWFKDEACTTPWIFAGEENADVVEENYTLLYSGWEVLPPVPYIVTDVYGFGSFATDGLPIPQNVFFTEDSFSCDLYWGIDTDKATDSTHYDTTLPDAQKHFEFQWIQKNEDNTETVISNFSMLNINDITEPQTMQLYCRATVTNTENTQSTISMNSPVFTVYFLGDKNQACFFDAGEGSGEMSFAILTKDTDGKISLPDSTFALPANADQNDEFIGWSVNGIGHVVKPGEKIQTTEQAFLATAQFGIPEYTVNYHINNTESDEDIVRSQTIRKGNALPEYAPEQMFFGSTNKGFAGWYKEAECQNAWDYTEDKVTNNTELYAKWIQYPSIVENLILTGEAQTLVSETDCTEDFEYIVREKHNSRPYSSVTKESTDTVLTNMPTAIHVGYYTIACKPSSVRTDNKYACIGYATINPKPIIEVIDNKTKKEGEEDPPFTYSYIGKIDGYAGGPYEEHTYYNGDDECRRPDDICYVLRRTAGETPGEYEINWVNDPPFGYHPSGVLHDPFEVWPNAYSISETRKGKLTITDRPDLTINCLVEGRCVENPFEIRLTQGTQTTTILSGNEEMANATSGKIYFDDAQQVTVSVNDMDAEHVRFKGWYSNNELLSTETSYTFTVDSDKTIQARFQGGAIEKHQLVIEGINDEYGYTGKEIKPVPEVYFGNNRLKPNVDYTVSYKDNINAGQATVYVKGKGMYTGTASRTFRVTPVNLNDDRVSTKDLFVKGKNSAQKPIPTVKFENKTLQMAKDYDFSWKNEDNKENTGCKAPGSYTVTLTGKNNFTGNREITFNISSDKQIAFKNVKISKIPDRDYTGSSVKPAFEVTLNNKEISAEDYDVTWPSDTVSPGTKTVTLTGKGKYFGEKTFTYKVRGISMSKIKVRMPSVFKYTGDELKPAGGEHDAKTAETTLSYDYKRLTKGRDYEVSYKNNINKGTATVTFTGKGKYEGKKTATFKIRACDISNTEDGVLVVENAQVAKYGKKGAKFTGLTVTFDGKLLKEGTDYTVSYKNNDHVHIENDNVTIGNKTEKAPTFVIQGKGNFTGKTEPQKFKIAVQNINTCTVIANDVLYKNEAGIALTTLTITDAGVKLKRDQDFTATWKYVADAAVTQKNRQKTIKISRKAGENVDIKDIVPAGTKIQVRINGTGCYIGTCEKTIQVIDAGLDISKAKVTAQGQKYNGIPVYPGKNAFKITLGDHILTENDFEILEIKNNEKPGTATVTLHGTGRYGGIKTINMKIYQISFQTVNFGAM